MAISRNNSEIIDLLGKKIEQALESHVSELDKKQEDLADKFERLSDAYNMLLARLIHVEATDFKGSITKIDSYLQKLIVLESDNKHLQKTVDEMKTELGEFSKSSNRMHTILWVVGLGVSALIVNVVFPVASSWIKQYLNLPY
jgi:chaperonin cofactor prefoldin